MQGWCPFIGEAAEASGTHCQASVLPGSCSCCYTAALGSSGVTGWGVGGFTAGKGAAWVSPCFGSCMSVLIVALCPPLSCQTLACCLSIVEERRRWCFDSPQPSRLICSLSSRCCQSLCMWRGSVVCASEGGGRSRTQRLCLRALCAALCECPLQPGSQKGRRVFGAGCSLLFPPPVSHFVSLVLLWMGLKSLTLQPSRSC